MSVTPALGRQKQDCYKLRASLVYVVTPCFCGGEREKNGGGSTKIKLMNAGMEQENMPVSSAVGPSLS